MGNQRSRFLELEAERARRRKARSTLREEDAWRMATAWKHDLQNGFVQLGMSHTHDMTSIVKSYEWVEFDFASIDPRDKLSTRKVRHLVSAMHAASVTWVLLSCCDGFSGKENPVFWKRVFCQYGRGREAPRGQEITDAVRFFTHEIFPRFRLKLTTAVRVQDIEALCRTIRQPLGDSREGATLKSTADLLAPYLVPERLNREIEVSMVLAHTSPLASAPIYEAIRHNISIRPRRRSDLSPDLVQMRVQEVALGHMELRTRDDIDAMMTILKVDSVYLPQVSCMIDPRLVRHDPARFLLQACGFDGPSSISDLTITCTSTTDRLIGAVCSILPHTACIQTLRLRFTSVSGAMAKTTWSDHLWHWLKYALLHPNAGRSSWRELSLIGLPFSNNDTDLLERLCEENDESHRCRYRQVRLRAGTFIREHPEARASQLHRLQMDTLFDLCHWMMQDKKTYVQGWVCVVLPGFGYGWADHDSIIDVQDESPSPSKSHLTGISWLRAWNHTEGDDFAVIIKLLELCGRRLEFLEATTLQSATADQVHSMLKAAPALRSLRIRHDGSFWNNAKFECDKNRRSMSLREVSLYSYGQHGTLPSQEALNGPLSRVTALQITGTSHPSTPVETEREMLSALLDRNPRLQYLHWADHDTRRMDYLVARRMTQRAVGTLDTEKAMTIQALSVTSRVAFLSVLRYYTDQGIIDDRWDSPVLGVIFEFAASYIPREIWIDRVAAHAVRRP
ncbi:hypothetical protein Poli38472_001261 [Pythium oligandrum]|uniref:Uncharacterized protein n=1 Tax=Pythium oligandrum TaxID=41045 RepID=A0A8K1FM93_PYTOL|nr:hypothetical protein Poli38472_001261 [Pythium oligandrum]|eukprot:TMW69105.1 hypothetical protein Poli38472_001261 [Pythium oligandrum]